MGNGPHRAHLDMSVNGQWPPWAHIGHVGKWTMAPLGALGPIGKWATAPLGTFWTCRQMGNGPPQALARQKVLIEFVDQN